MDLYIAVTRLLYSYFIELHFRTQFFRKFHARIANSILVYDHFSAINYFAASSGGGHSIVDLVSVFLDSIEKRLMNSNWNNSQLLLNKYENHFAN